ncbi:olfactory receptor 14L1-like [Alca torda]
MSNSSSITQFLLLAFADTRELQLMYFWLFLGICLAALLGNSLIISCDHRLQTPMFFLLSLSLLHLGSISTTLPKYMANSLWDTRHISYYRCAAQIFRAVLRLPSEQGWHKAFSTCLPHLAVVFLVVITGTFTYLKPPSTSSPVLDLVVAVMYLVVSPALNPLVYSIRNKELKDTLKRLICLSAAISCPSFILGTSSALAIWFVIIIFVQECLHPVSFFRDMNPVLVIVLTQRSLDGGKMYDSEWPSNSQEERRASCTLPNMCCRPILLLLEKEVAVDKCLLVLVWNDMLNSADDPPLLDRNPS